MKQFHCLLLLSSLLFAVQLQSQVRYLDEVFSEVNVEMDVFYGANFSVFLADVQNLTMDVYTPVGDDATVRPVVIYLHTGIFLPQYFNGQITGGKQDSTAVEICKRLARMGYVAVSATYRQGWLPLSNNQNTRTGSLLKAIYRGIIDTRTCIRFLRKTIVEDSNPYGIDGDKIVVWGQGTGGYLALGAATLDRYEEVIIDKFIDTGTLLPYVIEEIDGNVYGTNSTPFNLPNHTGYSSDFHLAVNMAGALSEKSWLEGTNSPVSEPAIMGFHPPTDPFIPFGDRAVIVPATGEFVLNVSGTRMAVEAANDRGSNDILDAALYDSTALGAYLNNYVEELSDAPWLFPGQAMTTLGEKHMYPFLTPDNRPEAGPWEWWNKDQLDAVIIDINELVSPPLDSDQLHNNGLLTNPDMSAEKARAYIDTIIAYYTPRACATFRFNECLNALGIVSIDEMLDANQVGMVMAPNPAAGTVFLQTHSDYPMKDIRLFNTQGLLVKSYLGIKSNSYTLGQRGLPPGLYIAIVHFEEGMAIEKIVFK